MRLFVRGFFDGECDGGEKSGEFVIVGMADEGDMVASVVDVEDVWLGGVELGVSVVEVFFDVTGAWSCEGILGRDCGDIVVIESSGNGVEAVIDIDPGGAFAGGLVDHWLFGVDESVADGVADGGFAIEEECELIEGGAVGDEESGFCVGFVVVKVVVEGIIGDDGSEAVADDNDVVVVLVEGFEEGGDALFDFATDFFEFG